MDIFVPIISRSKLKMLAMKKYFAFPVILISFLISMLMVSCFCETGQGSVTTQDRQLPEYDEIDANGQAEIILDYGNSPSMKIEIDTNLLQYVKTEVSGMKLRISESKCFKNVTTYKIYITTNKLSKLSVDGAVKINGESPIKSEKLKINTNGSGIVQLAVDADKLEINTDGTGELKLLGRALNLDVEIKGAGSVDAFGLQAKNVDAKVDGAGTCKIDVSEEFNGEAGGSGRIYYKGSPKKVNTDVTGSGAIQAK